MAARRRGMRIRDISLSPDYQKWANEQDRREFRQSEDASAFASPAGIKADHYVNGSDKPVTKKSGQ